MNTKDAIRTTNGRGKLFDSVLDTIGDTPVIRINNLGVAGTTIYVKAEFFNPAGSVKDRLALNIIEDAERAGVLKPGQTVVEATSGNTGIGLAIVCAQKGYPLVVTMADSFSVERRKLMRMLGAKVVLTPRAEKGFGMYRKAVELAEANGWFLARQFETAANADIHAATTAREIHRRLRRHSGWISSSPATAPAAPLPASAGCCARSGPRPRSCWPSQRMRAPVQRHGAGARPRRRPGRQPSGVRAASDPGLDPRLHPPGAAGGDRRASLRRGGEGGRPRRHQVGDGNWPCREGIFCGISGGATFAVARQDRRTGAGRLGDPVHAARYRRALPVDAALRGRSRPRWTRRNRRCRARPPAPGSRPDGDERHPVAPLAKRRSIRPTGPRSSGSPARVVDRCRRAICARSANGRSGRRCRTGVRAGFRTPLPAGPTPLAEVDPRSRRDGDALPDGQHPSALLGLVHGIGQLHRRAGGFPGRGSRARTSAAAITRRRLSTSRWWTGAAR